MSENWKNINENIIKTDKYYIKSITSSNDFIITLEGDNNLMQIQFENPLMAVRIYDEFTILQRHDKIFESSNVNTSNLFNPLFLITDSDYLKELSIQSEGAITEESGCNHYAIVTRDVIIDIVYRWEPDVEILKYKTL